MSVPGKASELVKTFEGCKLVAYRCPAGIWTCGWGSTGQGVDQTTEWTQQQADDRLESDLLKFERLLSNSVRLSELNDNQAAALISFVYNVGIGNFNTSTMRNLILAGKLDEAADQFPRWNKGGGRVLPGLIARRAAERELFLKPDEV